MNRRANVMGAGRGVVVDGGCTVSAPADVAGVEMAVEFDVRAVEVTVFATDAVGGSLSSELAMTAGRFRGLEVSVSSVEFLRGAVGSSSMSRSLLQRSGWSMTIELEVTEVVAGMSELSMLMLMSCCCCSSI